MSGWALPDYILKFKKPGENPEPVAGEFDYFSGDKSSFSRSGNLSIDVWQRYADAIWLDIDQSNTLNERLGRDEQDQRHVCALQLDVIERCLQLWTNEGDVVLTPFAGIGSELYMAVKLGRKALGFELKPSYFKQAIKNCRLAESNAREARLF